ncbi:hypothetical protein [Streptomyces sp. NPDC052693]
MVLNGGRVIARGEPDDVLSRPEVVEAYLGTRVPVPTAPATSESEGQ